MIKRTAIIVTIALVTFSYIVWNRSDQSLIVSKILTPIVKSNDLIITTGERLASASFPARHISIEGNDIVISFLKDKKKLSYSAEGELKSVDLSHLRGRIFMVSETSNPIIVAGAVSTIEADTYRISMIRTLKVEGRTWNFFQLFHSSKVVRKTNDSETICHHIEGGFHCGAEQWKDIKVMTLPFGGKYHNCIFAHPLDNSTLQIWTIAPMDTNFFSISGGIDDYGVGYQHGAEVRLSIISHGEEAGSVTFQNQPGFFTKNLVLQKPIDSGDLFYFQITTSNQDTRHFCFIAIGTKTPPFHMKHLDLSPESR